MADDQNKETKEIKEGLTLVLMRNAFYRDNYKRAVLVVLFVMIVDVVLAAAVVYHYINPPKPQYFAMNAQYQIIKWHPLSDPVVDNNFVTQWVSQSVQQAFSLDFVHWRDQLQTASYNFTTDGWHWFINAFTTSGNLDTLVKLQMVSNATVTGAPEVLKQAVLDGRYVWEVSLPILVTYVNTERTIPLPMKVTLIVERVSPQDNPAGIAINQFLPVVQGSKVGS